MFVLMNSAMMPQAGHYFMQDSNLTEFCKLIKAADRVGDLKSYIGYKQNADFLNRHTGVKIAVCTQNVELQDGDTLLIMRLTYRTRDKGARVNEGNFQFFVASYNKPTSVHPTRL